MKSVFIFTTILFYCLIGHSSLLAQDFTVTITPPENGQIEVLNGDIPVSSGETVAPNTELTFVTTPNNGYGLQQIAINNIPLAGGQNTYTVVENISVSADFVELPPVQSFTITIITPPVNGQIEVLNGDVPISSGDLIPENTTLTINTTPNPGYKLQQISVNDVPIEGNTYVITGDITISAEFVESAYAELTVKRPKNGKFVIDYIKDGIPSSDTINSTPEGEILLSIDEGSEVKIQATGNLNYSLREWTDSITGNANPLVFTINGQKLLGGIFNISPKLTIKKPMNGQINITYFKQGVLENVVYQIDNVEPNKELRVDIGSSVTLTALTNSDFEFVGWKGDITETSATITFMMEFTDLSVEASFLPVGAEIQVLMDRILAVTNKTNSESLKKAKYSWFRDGKFLSNGALQYIEVGSPIPSGEYTVEISFENKTTVILRRNFASTARVYPNPVNKSQPLTIFSDNPQEVTCEVYSITGNKINTQITPTDQGFTLSGITLQGTYIVHLKDKNSKSVLKVVVQ